MIVRCDNCGSAFQIKDELIREGGTKLRCSSCKHVFSVFPEKEKTPEPPAPDPDPVSEEKFPEKEPDTTQPESSPEEIPASLPETDRSRKIPESSGEYEETFLIEDTITNVDFEESAFRVEDIVQQYEELGSIGKGGMGEVLLAKDTQLLRKVAIKVLKDNSPAALSYFLREAQITAQLDHPNIVPLYTVKPPEKNESNVSFVMKLVKGKTLGDIISRARKIYKQNPRAELDQEINLKSRLEYFLKACEGISYAHRKQVVHRDLKPANIMVGDFGEVYVMDWGIAKMMQEDADDNVTMVQQQTRVFTGDTTAGKIAETQIGGIAGTLSYMSPEQAKGLPDVDHRSDIFSLGAVLYELITLKPARVGNAAQKLEWAEGGYLNTMEHFVPEQKIPPELKAIIHKATAFSARDRYQKVAQLAMDVRAFLRGDEVSELPDNLPRKIWRWMSKHREITVIALLAIFSILSIMTIFSLYREQAALKAARFREKRLTVIQSNVSAQAHAIDNSFLRLEDLASNLASNAVYLIQDAPENDEKFYWISDFRKPAKAPKDYVFSKLYGKKVSIQYPVVKPAPGVRHEDVAPLMRRLAPLRHHFRQTLLHSRGSVAPLTDEEATRLLTIHGVPIRWAYIGLEAGVMYSYPGKETYSDQYDPRRRPWYALGAHKTEVRWGNPYLDNQGQGLVLPVAASLYDRKNHFYGVLGMDVTFSDIIRDYLMRKSEIGKVVESFLLDDKGRIVVSSSQLHMKKVPTNESGGLMLKPFPIKEVMDSVLRGQSGLMESEREGKNIFIAFYRMPSLRWFYVEELDSESVLRD